MTVSFDYTKEDLTAFQIYYRESTGHKWFQPLLVLYPAVTIFLIIILIYLGREHFTGGIFILSCMSLMWLVIFIVFQFDNKRRMKKHWNKVLSSPKNASLFSLDIYTHDLSKPQHRHGKRCYEADLVFVNLRLDLLDCHCNRLRATDLTV